MLARVASSKAVRSALGVASVTSWGSTVRASHGERHGRKEGQAAVRAPAMEEGLLIHVEAGRRITPQDAVGNPVLKRRGGTDIAVVTSRGVGRPGAQFQVDHVAGGPRAQAPRCGGRDYIIGWADERVERAGYGRVVPPGTERADIRQAGLP